jgi:hypothetical protein
VILVLLRIPSSRDTGQIIGTRLMVGSSSDAGAWGGDWMALSVFGWRRLARPRQTVACRCPGPVPLDRPRHSALAPGSGLAAARGRWSEPALDLIAQPTAPRPTDPRGGGTTLHLHRHSASRRDAWHARGDLESVQWRTVQSTPPSKPGGATGQFVHRSRGDNSARTECCLRR